MLISINRPEKRNCVNQETAKQLVDAFLKLDADPDILVGVLTGKGGNFCAGYDLEELNSLKDTPEKISSFIKPAPMGPSHIFTAKPMVAAIDGYAVAGGLELALLCDLRVVEDNSILGVYCRRFGVPLIDGGTVRLQKIIGLGRALDLILTGRAVTGREALSMGLATQAVSTGTVLGRAMALATSLVKFPQECLKADRRSVYYSTFDAKSLEDGLDFEFKNGRDVIEKESLTGAKKFIESGIGKHGKFNLNTWNQMMEKGKDSWWSNYWSIN